MAKTRVGINGFGRIGRNFLRAQLEHGGDFEIVAANDIGDTKTMAHLLKHDSVLGNLAVPVEAGDDSIRVDGHEIKFVSERDPADLPWSELGVDVAIEFNQPDLNPTILGFLVAEDTASDFFSFVLATKIEVLNSLLPPSQPMLPRCG